MVSAMARGGGWRLEEYEASAGESPIRRFLEGLRGEARSDAFALIALVRIYGNELRRPQAGALGEGLFELRRGSVRIFYVFRPGRRIVLLDGIVKKQDRIPAEVLRRMRDLQRDVR